MGWVKDVPRRTVAGDRSEQTMNRDTADEKRAEDPEGTPKPGGLGQDGTIPPSPEGVAAGHTGEPSTFEPEEDEGA